MIMRINEIFKMPPTNNGSSGLAIWAYDDAVQKKSHILYQDQDTVIFQVTPSYIRYIVLNNENPILYLGLNKFLDGWQSNVVAAEPGARGKGLATQVYVKSSDFLKQPIYSDATQTDASRLGIWDKLIKSFPDRVVGYDQRTGKNLPLTLTSQGPTVNKNQPIYVDRDKKDAAKPLAQHKKYKTRMLKFLPTNSI